MSDATNFIACLALFFGIAGVSLLIALAAEHDRLVRRVQDLENPKKKGVHE